MRDLLYLLFASMVFSAGVMVGGVLADMLEEPWMKGVALTMTMVISFFMSKEIYECRDEDILDNEI